MRDDCKWINDLKVGDKVIVVCSRHYTPDCVDTVTKINKGSVGTKSGNFRKCDGYRKGDTGSWSSCWLEPATTETLAQIKADNNERNLRDWFKSRNFNSKSFTVEKLEKAKAILEKESE